MAVPTVYSRAPAHPLLSPHCGCCRFTLLCSLEGGRLQLVDVQPPGHPHIRTLPLSVQPTKVVSYRHSGLVQESSLPLLLVLGSQRGRCEAKDSAPLQCLLGVHPTTGGWFWRTPHQPSLLLAAFSAGCCSHWRDTLFSWLDIEVMCSASV